MVYSHIDPRYFCVLVVLPSVCWITVVNGDCLYPKIEMRSLDMPSERIECPLFQDASEVDTNDVC